MAQSNRDRVVETLNRLKDENWKVTFQESVLDQICKAVDQQTARDLWTDMCCGRRQKVIDTHFEGDESVMLLYEEVDADSKDGGFAITDPRDLGT